MLLWEDKQNYQLVKSIKKKWDKNDIIKIRNEKGEGNRQHRNTKDHKGLLWATICQENRPTEINWSILRKVQSTKTEPGRNRNYEQANYMHWNWKRDLKNSQKIEAQGQIVSQVNSLKHLEKS